MTFPRPVRSPSIRAAPPARRSRRATSSSPAASMAALLRVSLIALGETASFAGEIRAGRLRVDEGATMNATISMTPAGDAPPARRMEEHDDEATST